MSRIRDAIDRNKKATGQAMNRIYKLTDQPQDKDVRVFARLNANDLQQLAQKWGQDVVIDYVTTMEAKRMKGQT